jgi:hypothetical protein
VGRAWVEDAPLGHGARIVVTLPALPEDTPPSDDPGDAHPETTTREQASSSPATLPG